MAVNHRNLYQPIIDRSLINYQIQYLARNYDFGKQSRIAALIVQEVNSGIEKIEQELGIQRVHPFHLYTKWRGVKIGLPLFRPEYLDPILNGIGDFRESRTLVIDQCRKVCERAKARIKDIQLVGLVNPYSLVRTRYRRPWTDQAGTTQFQSTLRDEIDNIRPRAPFDRIDAMDTGAPVSLINELTGYVEHEGGMGHTVSNHIVQELITLRNVCYPRTRHLKSGEMPFLATSVNAHLSEEVATRFRRLTPVILTVWTQEERDYHPWKNPITDEMLKKRIVRVCFEAYRQNGLLSLMDLQWIFQISSRKVSELIRSTQKECNIIVPTPGTILDSGRSITHKEVIINLYLQGYSVREIAKMTYHSPRAVDNYIGTFESVLILKLYGIPKKLMARILRKGISLIEEHLELTKQHFKNEEEIKRLIYMKEVKV